MNKDVFEIVSRFTGIDEKILNDQTVIDRNAVKNSIIIHRMYAALAEKGLIVEDYHEVRTLLDLNKRLSTDYKSEQVFAPLIQNETRPLSIGMDIEKVSNMPETNDFRTHQFYLDNFDATEISHCILQSDPYASFCGLFAAKEAIVKADNSYKSYPFKNIVIKFQPSGMPVFDGFGISISHTSDLAVAVAVRSFVTDKVEQSSNINPEKSLSWVSVIAIILAIIAICLNVFNN